MSTDGSSCCERPFILSGACMNCGHGDTCCDCGKPLDRTKVFGMCRSCAEVRHAARQARKMLIQIQRDHRSDP